MNPLVCPRCGSLVEPAVPLACAACGAEQQVARQPLCCLTGPSGTGKSTLARALIPLVGDRFVVMEQDVLWVDGLRDPAGEHRLFRSTWLRMAAAIGQSGRPVLLCGTVVPPELEPLPERALFSAVHYLALMCPPEVLAQRLRDRPGWRAWDEARIAEALDYAEWLVNSADTLDPPVELLDTTGRGIEQTTRHVCRWLEQVAPSSG